MRTLSDDFGRPDAIPYFLWDEQVSTSELRAILRGPDTARRLHLVGKMLREARDLDVWEFVTPREVRRLLPVIERRLGRRTAFWRFLIEGWVADGLLD